MSWMSSTTLRSLGNEHLRMFRRTVKDQTEDRPKIVLPKDVSEHFILSEKKISFVDIGKVADIEKEHGGRLATLHDVIFNQERILKLQNICIWVSHKGMRIEKELYRLPGMRPITIEQAGELKWYEKLEISSSAALAAAADHPVAIYVGKLNADSRQLGLILSGVCNDAEGAHLAFAVL